MPIKKHLIIVGASFAGLTALRNLHKVFKITLVDSKDYFEFTPSILECFMNPQKLANITVPITQMKKFKFEFIQGTFIGITDDVATVKVLSQNLQIKFDYAFICTGSIQNEPIKNDPFKLLVLSDRLTQMRATRDSILKAKEILVVGGGTVGVELAAELASGGKSVTLITRRGLLPTMTRRAKQLAEVRLRELRVTCIENMPESELRLKFDLTFRCTGNEYAAVPISQCQTIVAEYPKKQIRVDEYLRVLRDDGYPVENIFCLGDISLSCLKEEKNHKTALSAELYGENAAHNLKQLNKKKKLKKIFWIPKTYIISMGGRNAILVFEQITIGGWIGYLAKIFIEKTKIMQYRGNWLIDLLWDLMHIVLNFLTMIYMILDLLIGSLPQDRRFKSELKGDIKQIQKEYNIGQK